MDPISGLESDRSRLVSDLYKSCYHRVFGFVSRKVGADDAEEIAHEVFIRLLRVRNLETMTVSVAYLLRIAENLIRRKFGRETRYRQVIERSGRLAAQLQQSRDTGSTSEVGPSLSGRSSGAAPSAGGVEFKVLEEMLSELTPSEQSAVRLIVLEELSYHAAANALGVPVSTINNWKHRACAKLRELIESREREAPRGFAHGYLHFNQPNPPRTVAC